MTTREEAQRLADALEQSYRTLEWPTRDAAVQMLRQWPEAGERVALQHVAVAEDGVLRWMSGRKLRECELYAMPDGGNAPALYAAPGAAQPEAKNDLAAAVAFVMGDDATKELGPKCCNKTVTVRCPGCPHEAQPAPSGMVPLQAGMDNNKLLAAWQKKLPNRVPEGQELNAFAVGTEVGFEHAQNLERMAWDRVHHVLKKHGVHPGRTDDHLADVIDKALAAAPQAVPQPLTVAHLSPIQHTMSIVNTLRTRPTGDPYLHMMVHEAADRIEAQDAENDGLRSSLHVANANFAAVAAERDRLREELEGARVDARRYRYLRDVAWETGSLIFYAERYGPEDWDQQIDDTLRAP